MSSPTEVADLYAEGWQRHLDLAEDLTESDGDAVTAACPEWTVRDVYAHLAGLQADVLAGRLEGAATDPWTARQVEERKGRTLAEVVEEYRETGPAVIEGLKAFAFPPVVIDQWNHEQDVRGAVGRIGSRNEPVVAWTVQRMVEGADARRREQGLPALRIEATSGTFTVGEGDPVATLAGTDFELVRMALGRRSLAQLLAMTTPTVEPGVVADMFIFGPRPDDLVE